MKLLFHNHHSICHHKQFINTYITNEFKEKSRKILFMDKNIYVVSSPIDHIIFPVNIESSQIVVRKNNN